MKTSTMSLRAAGLLVAAGLACPAMGQVAVRGGMNMFESADSRVASALSVLGTTGQDQIKVIVGPEAGTVQVFGAANVADGAVFTGITAVSVMSMQGQDFIEFETFAGELPAITVDGGPQNNEVLLRMQIPASASPVVSAATILGGAGEDKFTAIVESDAAQARFDWTFEGRANKNETNINITSSGLSATTLNLTTNGGLGDDVVSAEVVSPGGEISLSSGGSLGGGRDSATLKAVQLNAGEVNAALALNLGAGDDVAIVEIINEGGASSMSGTVLGGDGADLIDVKADTTLTSAFTADAGNGNDSIAHFVKFDLLGEARLLAGAGNDVVTCFITGVPVGVPFADGGAGFDIFAGFARAVNFESIN